MNGKQLKNSILQWAIQGKLVPQDPADEPAAVLLEKIRAEKRRLTKEGKLKKQKNESVIFRGDDNSHYEKFLATGEVKCIDDEVPFELPNGWEWCRFGDLMINRDSERIPLSVVQRQSLKKVYDYYGASGVIDKVDKYLFDTDLLLVGEDGANLINRSTPIAFIAKGKYWVNNHAHVLDACCGLNLEYVALFINAISLADYITGTAQPKMNQEKMNSILVAIPPLAEQKRIVARIEELLPLVERYSEAQDKLDRLNETIGEALKKSILQEAIQGKLVPQIESEGTAAELLERIKAEKQRLVKEGKLKKSALTDSVIFRGDDNRHYEKMGGGCVEIESDFTFPDTWQPMRLSTVCQLIDGEKKEGNYICMDAKYLRGKSTGDHLARGRFVKKGSNIILVDGENSGEVFRTPIDGYMGSTFKQLWIAENLYAPYVLLFIRFYKERLRNSKKGAAIPHLNKELFYNLIIGIPPLAEQKRIAGKVEQLCDMLK